MAVSWPEGLSSAPRREGYRPPRAGENLLETQTDAGPAKRRRRFTSVPHFVELSWRWSVADWKDKWLPFLEDDLEDGSLAFEWTEPLTGEDFTATIIKGSAGVTTSIGPGDNMVVSVKLRVI
ncbi:hypothetical protein [Maricaulis maris]|uniref:Uncharacterized protein n=1 Tax=Maricaulis maris TaxID=74318 RepID=A0A495D1L2_9PROT|nr:hypothetical protein [Maricaulis maris]RKQ95416.1 hypothetical protein C7435_2518 [Maricaulis maris]